MTYGDVALILILGVGGFITILAICGIAIGFGLIKLIDIKFWSKPIGNKPYWRE